MKDHHKQYHDILDKIKANTKKLSCCFSYARNFYDYDIDTWIMNYDTHSFEYTKICDESNVLRTHGLRCNILKNDCIFTN